MGFVFCQSDPFVGIDLDGCVVEGEIHPEADRIRTHLGSWWELSPSKTGLHIVVRGTLKGHRNRTSQTPWGGNFEAYDRGRFFTMSANGHGEIRDVQVQLDELVERFLPAKPKPASQANGRPATTCSADDRELLERAFAGRNGSALRALWNGDLGAYAGDHSAADLALIGGLSFWTGPDAERLDSLFRSSGLCREKWTSRPDYRERTIEAALSGRSEFHDWTRANGRPPLFGPPRVRGRWM
ncbi:MAG: phage NrS-1 polymerase family protein [Solirubrobacteraceae bacterium]